MEWNGVRFRVWAPDVERAVVVYENKNDPDSEAKPLEQGDGLWQGFVDFNEGIEAGKPLQVRIPERTVSWIPRIDPVCS